MLNTELNDSFRFLHYSRTQTRILCRKIFRWIPSYVCDSFFTKQYTAFHSIYIKEHKNIENKMKRKI